MFLRKLSAQWLKDWKVTVISVPKDINWFLFWLIFQPLYIRGWKTEHHFFPQNFEDLHLASFMYPTDQNFSIYVTAVSILLGYSLFLSACGAGFGNSFIQMNNFNCKCWVSVWFAFQEWNTSILWDKLAIKLLQMVPILVGIFFTQRHKYAPTSLDIM